MPQPLANEVTNAVLLVYAALFPIVNPLGSAPVFLNITRYYAADTRHALAGRVALNGFLLLLGSIFVGSHILNFFGITLPAVRLAGGFVVTSMAWQLLRDGDDPKERDTQNGAANKTGVEDAFYPLTMPLTVGPGSIATAITLGSQRPASNDPFHLAALGGAAILGLFAIAATIYVSYRFAENIEKVLGRSGTNVLIRLSAFILLCIGVQIMWSGYVALPPAAH